MSQQDRPQMLSKSIAAIRLGKVEIYSPKMKVSVGCY